MVTQLSCFPLSLRFFFFLCDEWKQDTHSAAASLSGIAVLQRIQNSQGQCDRTNLCCVGPQLLVQLFTGGWTWKPDKAHTHMLRRSKQCRVSRLQLQRRRPSSSHWYGYTASYMPALTVCVHLYPCTSRWCHWCKRKPVKMWPHCLSHTFACGFRWGSNCCFFLIIWHRLFISLWWC